MRKFLIIQLFLLVSVAEGKNMRIRTVDETGAPFPNVLIIVRSVTEGEELGRYLSDSNGETPEIKIDSDLDQVIATCPYGICKTAVQEFLATTAPSVLVVPLSVRPTDEIGELVSAKTAAILFRPQSNGKIGSGVNVFVRDDDAVRQRWYKTDADGKVSIQILGKRTNVVIRYANTIYGFVLADECPLPSGTSGSHCVVIQNSLITLDVPSK